MDKLKLRFMWLVIVMLNELIYFVCKQGPKFYIPFKDYEILKKDLEEKMEEE